MFSRLFGSKKEDRHVSGKEHLESTNLSFLKTDMHSHFVPGIDDGAQTVADSIALIKEMKAMGYSSIVTTPHIKSDHYPNTRETIEGGLQTLRHALASEGIAMPVKAAAEYYIDDYFLDILGSEPLLTIYENQVLVELSFMFEPVRLDEIIFRIFTAGYKPILAHPERYFYFHEKPSVYSDLKDKGVLLQMNLLSLTGYYGKGVKQMAEWLLEKRLYAYCGTDMHHLQHAESLKKLSASKFYPTLLTYPFLNAKLP